ncbi:hypothetical protein [Bacteroides sp. 224]|uniref:hypothetical protein n=1 Tax=Bacteroides sp. 224 TaxID=2302936 RepID=UPI0013D543BD|nr:hypothetical protein [Bacteroides sp. 224]
MRGKYLQNKATTGRFTLPVVILITIVCWVVSFFLISDLPERANTYTFLKIISTESMPTWTSQLISYTLHLAIGYFLISLNNTFAIIRVRASIQTAIYLLLIAACPAIHRLYSGDAASIAMLLSVYYLFGGYQSPQPAHALFHSFIFLSIGSLAFPKILLFAPILWIGAFNFKALTFRSFLASLIGWSIPYWFFLGHSYFFGEIDNFYRPFIELITFHPIQIELLEPWELATLGYCFILFAASAIHIFVSGYKDKIRTRSYLHFLILLDFCVFCFILLQPIHFMDLLSLLMIGVSILIGHMMALTGNKASNIFFIACLICLVTLFGFNVWTLL